FRAGIFFLTLPGLKPQAESLSPFGADLSAWANLRSRAQLGQDAVPHPSVITNHFSLLLPHRPLRSGFSSITSRNTSVITNPIPAVKKIVAKAAPAWGPRSLSPFAASAF